jgi:hypothetical protein
MARQRAAIEIKASAGFVPDHDRKLATGVEALDLIGAGMIHAPEQKEHCNAKASQGARGHLCSLLVDVLPVILDDCRGWLKRLRDKP